ncbi:MAG TPA: tripartite tricarboxylate transporter substrate binding protein [Burkholderiales bacterium]|nr:tripartite tricarboxylate transporter substrate binding protein [Burkholderiales bacterium]
MQTVKALAIALLALAAGGALAQQYPDRPVRFIAGYPPGSASDNLARILAHKMTEVWGQQVIVDNRPGAAGNIAAETTAKAAPDGYTILLVATNHAIVSSLYKKLPFHPINDFAPITHVSSAPAILVTHPSLPVKNVAEFVKLAKTKPGQLNYGSSGNGATPHLAMELLKSTVGIDLIHVPYKGIPPAMTDLLAGQIQAMFSTMAPAMPLVRAARLRALAVTSPQRSPAAPDVPTMSETIPGFEATSWQGVLAPAGTPPAVVQKVNETILKIIKMPDVHQRLIDGGYIPAGTTSPAFAAFIKSEMVKWAKVVKAAGATLD